MEQQNFEAQFQPQSEIITALMLGDCGAARTSLEKLWTAHCTVLAYIDEQSQRFVEGEFDLRWLTEDSREDWFAAGKIYRLKVRHHQNDKVLMLEEIIESNVLNADLEAYWQQYQMPVYFHSKTLGQFEWDKHYKGASGEVDWLGNEICLYIDEVDDTMSEAEIFSFAEEVVANAAEWDEKARTYLAEKLLESANDWAEEGAPELTAEQLSKRVSLSELSIGGTEMTFFYDDDDIFYGHSILVEVDENGTLYDAYIAG
ncbi:DUF2262 domain-containing protein [Suttonella ornithocola]|uniref:Uncharacterized protein conserved in bacteria n=1 Tax=Suttonella ornithocola TaxID=279832 RepID=A0A380MUI9_9GAMM|nr:DUF2262 domain-containing protein [Suttonella ornithocola]SUO95706.1 Uncharacterized protein conserved in bacteria [Suttonella ornithocola]